MLVGAPACLECHAYRGMGPRSHHIDALTGGKRAGFALPLEEYPEEPWHSFLFDQVAAAEKIGVKPLELDPTAAGKLYELVVRDRHNREISGQ